MNSNLKLALRISGTKERRAGFAPLVTVGVLAGNEGDNMYRSSMVAERPVYIIKHVEGYILYQLIDRGAKPFDADANGLLSIALTISSNAQLAGGKSPFTLLDEVYKKFVETYMEPTSDGRLSFLDTDNDNEIFRGIVGRYSLEERKSSYVTMNPAGLTGIVCVPPADLEDFFKDTQYKEFASYKDIEVGVNCHAQVSPGFDKLQIPLPPPVFAVWVNGKPTGKSLQFHEDGYTAKAANTDLYTYESVDFTLGELLEAPSNRISKNGATVTLDFIKNCISCDLKKKDIYYKIVYDWTDNIKEAQDKIKSLIIEKKVKIKLGKKDISNTVFAENEFKAADINNCDITIDPQVFENFKLSLKCTIDSANHEIVSRIIIGNRPKSPQTVGSRRITQSNVNQTAGTNIDKTITQTDQPKPQNKKKFDLISFVLGLVAGLLIGLGIWGCVALLGGDKAETPANPEEKVDTTKVDVPANNPTGFTSDVTSSDDAAKAEAETEINAEAEAEAKAKALAESEAKAAKAKKKAEAIAAIIQFVSKKPTLAEYKRQEGYQYLSKEEKTAIESFINLDQDEYKQKLNSTAHKKLKNTIKEANFSFNSMSDIYEVQKVITAFLNDPNNKK